MRLLHHPARDRVPSRATTETHTTHSRLAGARLADLTASGAHPVVGRVLAFPGLADRARDAALTVASEPPRLTLEDRAPNLVWVRDLAYARALQESAAGAAAPPRCTLSADAAEITHGGDRMPGQSGAIATTRVQLSANGCAPPAAQGCEHRPSKPRVAGSKPAGRANLSYHLSTLPARRTCSGARRHGEDGARDRARPAMPKPGGLPRALLPVLSEMAGRRSGGRPPGGTLTVAAPGNTLSVVRRNSAA